MGVLENATSDTNRLAGRNATSALNRCPEKNPEDIRSRVVSDLVDLTATLFSTTVCSPLFSGPKAASVSTQEV